MFLDGDWRAESRESRWQYKAWVQGEEEKFSHLCQRFSINISLQGEGGGEAEDQEQKSRSSGQQASRWEGHLRPKASTKKKWQIFCWALLQPGDMNRDVFFLEDLLKAQMAQPHHQGYQVVTSVGYQDDSILMMLLRHREGWKTRWWRHLPTWRRGKRFGGKQLLRQSQSDLEIFRRGGQ